MTTAPARDSTASSFSLSGTLSTEFHRLDEGLEQRLDDPAALEVVGWLREQIAKPDARVGRPGPVCPIVPIALRSATIWLGIVDGDASEHGSEQLSALLLEARERFSALSAESPKHLTAFLLLFPRLGEDEAIETILAVQEALKMRFVQLGLMLGEFFPGNEVPSLRNEHFFPFQSPVPMLGFRHMVEEDVGFFELGARADPASGLPYLRAYVDYFLGVGEGAAGVARARRSLASLERRSV